MTKSICFIFAAGLALAALASAEITEEESFAEATSFVQSFMAEGKGDSACTKVANDSMKDIVKQCDDLQKIVDTTAKGDKESCCKRGLAAKCLAAQDMTWSAEQETYCKSEVTKLAAVKVSFPKVALGDLDPKKCKAFFSGASYKNGKKALDAKKKECVTLNGSKKAYTEAANNAVTSHDGAMRQCHKHSTTALQKLVKKSQATCGSATNKKAFTRAKHMLCVLAGTSMKDCKVGEMPQVKDAKMTAFDNLKCSSSCTADGAQTMPNNAAGNQCNDGGSKGFRISRWCGNGKLAIQYRKSQTWNSAAVFACPPGWKWATYQEWTGITQAGPHSCHGNNAVSGKERTEMHELRPSASFASGDRCGVDARQRWRFSNSKSNAKYQHSGNYMGYQHNQDWTAARTRGALCIKIGTKTRI